MRPVAVNLPSCLRVAPVFPRRAIEDGLQDTAWAKARLHELELEKQEARALRQAAQSMPKISIDEIVAYRRNMDRLMATGSTADLKKLVRASVAEMKLAPEDLTVEIQYKLPEPVLNGLVAQSHYRAIHDLLASHLVRRWVLPRNGRRTGRTAPSEG